MKRIWTIMLCAAAAICFARLPGTGADAAKLLPAQTLVISRQGDAVTVETDVGACGTGKTLADALRQTARSAAGTLFLDTAEYIVLTRETWDLLPQLVREAQLRPAAKPVLCGQDVIAAQEANEILQAHPTEATLAQTHAALLRGEALRLRTLQRTQEGGWALA